MAITLVGSPQVAADNNGAGVTITFGTPPLTGDLVIVVGGRARRSPFNVLGPTDASYQAVDSIQSTGTGVSTGQVFCAWSKRMGATPDTTVTCQNTGNAQDACAYACIILRGVDATTPLDVAAVWATASTPGPITTVTDGALIVVATGLSHDSDFTADTISGYSGNVVIGATDTNRQAIALAYKTKPTHGTETPGQWSGWTQVSDFCSVTLAIRPAATGHTQNIARVTAAATARALTRRKARNATRVTATSSARALSRAKAAHVGRATATSTTKALGRAKTAHLARATGTGLARALQAARSTTIGRVTAAGVPRALGRAKTAHLGRATGVGVAERVGTNRAATIARVIAHGTAAALDRAKTTSIGRAAAAGIARVLQVVGAGHAGPLVVMQAGRGEDAGVLSAGRKETAEMAPGRRPLPAELRASHGIGPTTH